MENIILGAGIFGIILIIYLLYKAITEHFFEVLAFCTFSLLLFGIFWLIGFIGSWIEGFFI